MDVEKQRQFWLRGAREDWDVARELVARGRLRHGLFFAHLAIEKALKSLVCRQTADVPPRTHNLLRLAELAALSLLPEQVDLLAELNAYQLEGRYPDAWTPPPDFAESQQVMERAEEMLRCLTAMS